jgi:hypothetical protein
MRQISTKGGTRLRCIQSIKAIKKTAEERDAYGKQIPHKMQNLGLQS